MPDADDPAELARIRSLLVAVHERVHTNTGELERNPAAPPRVGGLMALIDSFREIDKLPRGFGKAKRERRALTEIEAITIHQTAVEGGFGVSGPLLRRHGGDPVAARQARYRDTPYHGLYSPRDRMSVIQWPAWAYTFHGHGGNRYSLGWAYDGRVPGDELDVEGAREALRHFVLTMREAGARLRYVEAHRQHSRDRAGDPGPEIWSRVVRPLLAELELAERPTLTTGSGLALPDDWLV